MNERKTVFWLTLTALGFRIFHLTAFSNDLIVGGDQMQNITLARRFADGDFYGVLDVYWAPLYPILIGIVSFFVDSLTLPSVIISVIAGTLAVPAVFYFVKQSYESRAATIAAAIAVFYPHLINSVFAIGTENIYILLMTGALFVGWNGLQKDSARDYLMVGILVGLAYLTRPEAFGYLAFFAAAAFGKTFFQITSSSQKDSRAARLTAALLLGFVLLAAPYIFYLRAATGNWIVSAKAMTNIAAGELQEETAKPASADSISNFEKQTKIFFYSFTLGLIDIHKNFHYLMPVFLLGLVALGLFGEPWNRERFAREIYFVVFCVLTVLGYAATVSQTRYFYVLLPIFLGWTAGGILRLHHWVRRSLRKCQPERNWRFADLKSFAALSLLFIYLYVLPLNFYMLPPEKILQSNGFEEREAGLWLKKHGKPSPLVFSASRRPVFYAEARQLSPTQTEMPRILEEIRNSRADYVIASERTLKRNPYLKGLKKMLMKSSDFELVYQNNQYQGYEIAIFKVK